MIKWTAKSKQGTPVLFLGISGENVARLAAGEPILVTAAAMAEMGLPAMEIVLHYGRTEQDIIAEMKAHGVRMTVRPAGG
jgi:hypothetical protein